MRKLKFLIILIAVIGFGLSVDGAFAGGGEENGEEAEEHVHKFEAGTSVLKKCLACHSIVEGENRHGPSLFDVFGRVPGTMDGFKYSPAMTAFGEAGNVWNAETLSNYLRNPKTAIPGNRMAFPGIKNEDELEDLLHYLETLKAE
jgi:cytochrome c